MTQGIENMLGLPHLEDILKEQGTMPPKAEPEPEPLELADDAPSQQTIDAIQRASTAITQQGQDNDGRDHAEAMDELYEETRKHSQDLMDLGFNIDVRSARGIFEVAASMYKNAIDAKNSKRDAQLKFIKLMLDKRKLDMEEQKLRGDADSRTIDNEGVIIENRNDIIRRLREQAEMAKKAP